MVYLLNIFIVFQKNFSSAWTVLVCSSKQKNWDYWITESFAECTCKSYPYVITSDKVQEGCVDSDYQKLSLWPINLSSKELGCKNYHYDQ